MGEVRVLPSANLTVEVALRYLLERREDFAGLVIVSISKDGNLVPWVTDGTKNCCVAQASLILQQEALYHGAHPQDSDAEPTG